MIIYLYIHRYIDLYEKRNHVQTYVGFFCQEILILVIVLMSSVLELISFEICTCDNIYKASLNRLFFNPYLVINFQQD